MSNEHYRSPRPQPQPGMYEQDDSRYPQPPPYQSSQSLPPMADLEKQRTRGQSNAEAYNTDSKRHSTASQPINDAVASAINTTETKNALSPEILNHITAQITATVMQQLQANNMAPQATSQTPYTNANLATSPSTTGSPPTDHRQQVYTPPSPYRASEEAAQTVSSPTPAQSKTIPTYGRATPSPDNRPTSALSHTSQAEDSDTREERPSRPKGPKRLSTSTDPTILEKIWGTLFNEQGQATKRLGQFLRGIAVHLIEDYEPKHSLVILPEKMQKYYEDTTLPNEIYPWQMVFDDHSSSISRLFRDVEAQHHLVQERLDERPDTPGLTPIGFERWATLMLLAHPELEFARLQKTALDMPISNPDDRKERFPKEISRRLFPMHDDTQVIAKLQKAMITHCNITIAPRHGSTANADTKSRRTDDRATDGPQISPTYPPPSSKTSQDPLITPAASRSNTMPIFAQRERKPHSNPPSESAFEDDGDQTPQPIERERKPYVAQPGGGKTYEDLERVTSSNSQQSSATPFFPEQTSKLSRSSSMASHGRPNDLSKSRPIPITVHQRPPPSDGMPMSADSGRRHRSNSIYNRDRGERDRERERDRDRDRERDRDRDRDPVRESTHGTRVRSPSASNSKDYGHRSENDMSYGTGSSYHSTGGIDAEQDGHARRYRDYERERETRRNDHFDAARMSAYDPREREREPRQRFQSTVGLEGGRGYYASDEEYHRAMGGIMGASVGSGGHSGGQGYPPNSYHRPSER